MGRSDRTTSTRRWSKQHGSEYHGQSLITVWSTRTLWNMQPLPRVLLFTLFLVLFSKHYICRVLSGSDCLSHHFLLPIPARRVFNLTLSLSWKQSCRTECRFCGFFFFWLFNPCLIRVIINWLLLLSLSGKVICTPTAAATAERVLDAKLQCLNAVLWILLLSHFLFQYMAISSPYEFAWIYWQFLASFGM